MPAHTASCRYRADVFKVGDPQLADPPKSFRYFWFQTRNFAPGDAAVAAAMTDGIRKVFKEDQAVLKAVQIGMTQRRTPNIDIAVDAGPLRFRRQLARLVAAERESAAVAIAQNQE